MNNIEERYRSYQEKLARLHQSHLLAFWPELDGDQRQQLLNDLDAVDFEGCAALVERYVRRAGTPPPPGDIQPADTFPIEPHPEQVGLYDRARRTGAEAIRAGRVAAFTVAGGQGTRLGFDGPKGALPISPIRNATLFQLFAESLIGTGRCFGRRPRWYIMTSTANHAETVAFFEQNGYFGLPASDIMFFQQGRMPAFLPDGRIALAEKHRLALSPDGHGGSLRALAASGALDDMRAHGIDVISYFQVDNPLVRTVDPLFIGLHLMRSSEMSSKAVAKAHDLERVGVFAMVNNKLTVVEYSDLPETLARAKNDDGTRRFDAGSIAVHVISRSFVERLTAQGAAVRLPWHRAEKKVDVIDEQGRPRKPTHPNAVKLEMFVFDAIPLAQNPLVLLTLRGEEFSPVKNAIGDDSPATARGDMVFRAARWLEYCGVNVPRDLAGRPLQPLEISPAFALDAADLKHRLGHNLPTVDESVGLLLA